MGAEPFSIEWRRFAARAWANAIVSHLRSSIDVVETMAELHGWNKKHTIEALAKALGLSCRLARSMIQRRRAGRAYGPIIHLGTAEAWRAAGMKIGAGKLYVVGVDGRSRDVTEEEL